MSTRRTFLSSIFAAICGWFVKPKPARVAWIINDDFRVEARQ